jgi:hypothetical protein
MSNRLSSQTLLSQHPPNPNPQLQAGDLELVSITATEVAGAAGCHDFSPTFLSLVCAWVLARAWVAGAQLNFWLAQAWYLIR